MKALVFTLSLCGLLLPLTGCETLSDTPSENRVRLSHAALIDLKQAPDDLERVLYLERPVWLSRYPIPND